MLRQSVDNEDQEDCEDTQDNQSDDELLKLPPDEEDKGLHGVNEPVEVGGRTTGRATRK